MSTPIFFPTEVWNGKQIQFTHPSASTWTIDAKIGDETCLWTNRDETANGKGSVAICTFACHRPNDNVQATMQVSMQIRYRGSEFLPASMRRNQASEKLTFGVHLQLEAHELLLKSQCEHAPQDLGLRRGKQDEDGLVPGGSVVYLVVSNVPGVVLGEPTVTWKDAIDIQDGIFWGLEREDRDRIRLAFETAYR
ncbi:uncharacterized protein LDX57_011056 [Aspergillus melleus]|uniref:uncharacterized protein n=1 Tax=Aspergillus melleus TaxID=138277 RepID=UPI001E8D8E0C|nr:uncharacterized protein LDX57_011056 [Aspergillus melleus]KAH8433422.1 hypothetical protein LDX57_011056 [Aspergillus melleus]